MSKIAATPSSNPVGGLKKVKALLLGSAGDDVDAPAAEPEAPKAKKGDFRGTPASAASSPSSSATYSKENSDVTPIASSVSLTPLISDSVVSTPTGESLASLKTRFSRPSTTSVAGVSTSSSATTTTPHTTGEAASSKGNVTARIIVVSAPLPSTTVTALQHKEIKTSVTPSTATAATGGVAGSKKGVDAMIVAKHTSPKMTVTTSATGLAPGTGVNTTDHRADRGTDITS